MHDLPSKTFINLKPFRRLAESTLKIYPSMGSKMYRFLKGNVILDQAWADLRWSGMKSEHYRWEVWRSAKNKYWFCTRGVTVTSLNPDRAVINFQKMQDLPSTTFINLGPFRGVAESTLKIYRSMGAKCMDFHKKMHVFDLTWADLNWSGMCACVHLIWCDVMYDVMCDVWGVMFDVWCDGVMCEVWCLMCEVM